MILDLLMKRYNNIEYIMSLDAIDGLEIITKAIEGNNKDKLYMQYVQLLPWMSKDNYISFNEFYKQNTRQVVDKKVSKEEAYKNANNILKMVCKG